MARIYSIARFTYQLGCVVALIAVVYRLLAPTAVGAAVFSATGIHPRNCLQLSVLSLLICIASEAYARTLAKSQ